MNENTVVMDWKSIGGFMEAAFVRLGVPPKDAHLCADVLLTADKLGITSHGVNRFKPIYIDRLMANIHLPVTELETLRETMTTAVFDAHNGMGMVAAARANQAAIDKAKACGLGMTAVRNSNHFGIAGYYVLEAVRQGCIGIAGTNARPSIAPTFGVENMLGTNPLTFGMPTDEAFPFLLDCATSIIQRGKIEYFARAGLDTPAGTVIGRDGSALCDSAQILRDLVSGDAALCPLGGIGETLSGYKGYGYATVVEILSAALQGGSFLKALSGRDETGAARPYSLGHFFLVIDPEAFLGLDNFKKTAGDILRALRASEKAPGAERIYTAGEKEYLVYQERKDSGVPLPPSVQAELCAVRDALGLSEYRFPFER